MGFVCGVTALSGVSSEGSRKSAPEEPGWL